MNAMNDPNEPLDSKEPELPVRDFLNGETHYTALEKTFPDKVEGFRAKFDKYVKERYEEFKKMAENE